jgi:hypothetical protein
VICKESMVDVKKRRDIESGMELSEERNVD